MNNNLNKNISVWRGDSTPPTDYHLWETSDGKIKTKINNEWKQVTSPTDKEHIDRAIYNISTLEVGTDRITYNINHNNGDYDSISLERATEEQAGLMNTMQVYQLGTSINELSMSSSSTSISIGCSRNNYNLPISTIYFEAATESHAGPMSVEDKTKLDTLTTSIKDLGHFNTEADALNYLKTLPICADTKIIHAHLTYGDKNHPNTITLIQNVTNSWTRQVLFKKNKIQQRAIYFTNDERTKIYGVEDLQPLFGDRLKWDNNTHKYILSQFNDNFNGPYTDPIPMVSTTTDGLMSKEDKVTYDNAVALYTKLNNIKIKSITPTNSNVLKSYQLIDSNNNVLGETINIPKDSSIKTVEIADTKATIDSNGNIIKGSGDTALSIVYILADGSYKIVNASLSKFLEESEFGNGLQVVNHKVSVLKDPTSEDFLKVTDKGISISGVRTAIINETNKYLPKTGGSIYDGGASEDLISLSPRYGIEMGSSGQRISTFTKDGLYIHGGLEVSSANGFAWGNNSKLLKHSLKIGSGGINYVDINADGLFLNNSSNFIQAMNVANSNNKVFIADGSLLDISSFFETSLIDYNVVRINDNNNLVVGSDVIKPESLEIGTQGLFVDSNIMVKGGVILSTSTAISESRNYIAWSTDGGQIELGSALCIDKNNVIRIHKDPGLPRASTLYLEQDLNIARALRVSSIYAPTSELITSKTKTWSKSGEEIDLQNYLKCMYTNSGYRLFLTYPDTRNNTIVESTITKFTDIYNKTETNTLLDKKFGCTSSEYNEDGSLTISFYKDNNSLTNKIDNVDILIRTSTRSGLMSTEDAIKLDNFEGALSESDIAALF